MSKTVSNSDLEAVCGYLESYIELSRNERKNGLREVNYVRRCHLLLARLRRKLS